jgi:hypothetical protein
MHKCLFTINVTDIYVVCGKLIIRKIIVLHFVYQI